MVHQAATAHWLTTLTGTYLYTWVKGSNVGQIFCSEKSKGPGRIRTWDPSIQSLKSYH